MRPLLQAVALSCVILSSAASAQTALGISGHVYDDPSALAVQDGFRPIANASVHVHRDDGDRVPGAGDLRIGSTRTDAAGVYALSAPAGGDYWIVVDSRSVGPQGTWAEQTFGPSGALCAQPDGSTRSNFFAGSCFGGRREAGSDDASSVATAEHVALVQLRQAVTGLDFAFSFNAVTTLADGDAAIQGSLRQFLVNANALRGPNRMRFVPVVQAVPQRETPLGLPPRWWSMVMATPLPELKDEDTTIDGTAHNFLSPASEWNVHPGKIGEAATVKPDDRHLPRLEKPELELQLSGAEGIVCSARCTVRGVAVHGPATTMIARADSRIEHALFGASPDGVNMLTPGTVGLQIEKGTCLVRHLLITFQSSAGVIVAQGARLDAEHLDVSRCGQPQSGGGVVLLSDGSALRSSTVTANPGAGIVLGSLDGKTPASGNTIDGSTISSNQGGVIIGPGSSRNVIARNDIMWNTLGGVTVAPFESAPPRDNRISANRFDENGLRPIVLTLEVDDPNTLLRAQETCSRNATGANDGISPPRIMNVQVSEGEGLATVTIRGQACPGETVELYQSFVTSGVVEQKAADVPLIRSEKTAARETLTTREREFALPSIGEFNYLGVASTGSDGTFVASFPLPTAVVRDIQSQTDEEDHVWASEVLLSSDADERAFSGIAIDPTGNTSEMSVRRRVD